MFKIYLLTLVLLLLFSGCGPANINVPSDVSEADIMNSTQKAYVIFATQKLGGNRGNPIFEYFPESETFKLVTILGSNQKYIYPTDEGVHYFYSMGGETYDFLKVNAEAGKKYYAAIETVFWSWHMTTPIIFEPTKDVEKIQAIEKQQLIQNNATTIAWYNKRKDNPNFKAAVKERFNEWKQEDIAEKTLHKGDGFPIK